MNQYTYLNQKTHLTIRTETFREFLEFHLVRAEAAEQAMELFPGNTSPEGISEPLKAVHDAAQELQYHCACIVGVLNLFGINRRTVPDCCLDLRELRNKVRRYFEHGDRY